MTNVVLLTIDSLRADHLGCFGYERDTSPFMDSLAEDGIYFDAYANSNWTRASFPSIITSTYPLEYGGFEYLSDSRVTVGEAVTKEVSTAAFHSNLWLSRDYNYDRGFDKFYDSKTEPSLLAKIRAYLKTNLDHDSAIYRFLQWMYDTAEEKSGIDLGQTYKDAETMTELTTEWISGANDDFFVWTHFMDVHHPYVPHDSLEEIGIDNDLSERDAIKLRRKFLESPDEVTDSEFQTLVDLYDGEIRYVDNQLSQIYNFLEKEEIVDDTAIIVTSDHGEEFREHGGFSHTDTMYDEILHVPLIISEPRGVKPGKQSENVELLDVSPTVCDIIDVEKPENYRGQSALDIAGSGRDKKIISETNKPSDYKLSIRTDQFKYIWDRYNDEKEFFNLEEDPGENNDLSGTDEHEAKRNGLHDKLVSHLELVRETNEELPDVSMDSEVEQRLEDLGYLE